KQMKKQMKKAGISLIVLVITILVMIILAGAVLVGLVVNNPIGKAKEATFKSDIDGFKSEFTMKLTGKVTSDKNFLPQNINVAGQDVKEYIPSLKKDYENKIEIIGGEIYYTGTNEKEILWCEDAGITVYREGQPTLLEGMVPIKWDQANTVIETTKNDPGWYNYRQQKWANARTKDGSMWVWVPRFAYKMEYLDTADKGKGGTVNAKILRGTGNKYLESGNIQDISGEYKVHPAFTDETAINFANGGWDKELTGIWVAKFEAGYAGGNNTAPKKETNVVYTQSTYTDASNGLKPAEDFYEVYGNKTTNIKYPVFMPNTYSAGIITASDAFDLCKTLADVGNIYGINSVNADSHLIKNSEWGAVTYFAKSQFGVEHNIVSPNNKTVSGVRGVFNLTSGGDYALNRLQSTTHNIYGVYDLGGGANEVTAGCLINNLESQKTNANSLACEENRFRSTSDKYLTMYALGAADNEQANRVANPKYGDALNEISTATTTWESVIGKYFAGDGYVMYRGGSGWYGSTYTGMFVHEGYNGFASKSFGYRPVLIAN
ncbi:MAG: hypothetical protein RR594_05065, partial [Clostridia bacterium]